MDAAASGGAYADARFIRQRSEYVATRNGAVDDLHHGEDEGIGVRVRVGGAWGFAATRDCSKAGGEGTNPFEVPLERKLERLLAADAALGTDPRLNLRQAHYGAYERETIFAS